MRTRKRVKKEKRSERDLLPVAVGGGRAFVSVEDLQKAIEQFLAAWNNDPKPFVWTATVESIVEKLSRCKQTLERIKPGCIRSRMRKTKEK